MATLGLLLTYSDRILILLLMKVIYTLHCTAIDGTALYCTVGECTALHLRALH